MSSQAFEVALRRLVTDEEYAKAVEKDAQQLTLVYNLTQEELNVLASVFKTAHPEAVAGFAVIVACYVKCTAAEA